VSAVGDGPGGTDPVSVLLRIEGLVQGVGYRAWTVRTALTLGLDGWVRNRRDGSVEALVAGPAAAVAAMEEACRRGPRLASVSAIRRAAAEAPEGPGFEQRPTV